MAGGEQMAAQGREASLRDLLAKAEAKIREYREDLQRMAFDAAVAEERERRRMAVVLHDRIGQSLALAKIKLDAARGRLAGEPREAVDAAIELLGQSIAETRTLTFDLSPPILYDLGLKDALSWLVGDVAKRCGMRIELVATEVSGPRDAATASLVFRSVRELLMNVLKHAGCASAKVSLCETNGHVFVEVLDEGIGFDLDRVASWSEGGGFGLFSVREQIAGLGGTVEIVTAPGQGTRVGLRIPLARGGR